MPSPHRRSLLFTLAAVAGFVDTASFVGLDGVFTAHVTGNLVIAGAHFAAHRMDNVLGRLIALPVFAVVVAGTSLLTRRLLQTRARTLLRLLCAEALGLFAFALVCIEYAPRGDPVQAELRVTVCSTVGIAAMGLQNALMREVLPQFPATTVMTGNFTQVILDSVRLVLGPKEDFLRERALRTGTSLLGFMVGAALGSFCMRQVSFLSLLAPASAVAWLALRESLRTRRGSDTPSGA